MAKEIDLKPYLDLIRSEVELVVSTVKEKGGKRFGKSFALAGIMVFLAYVGAYAPAKKKKARLQSEIGAARTLAQFGAQYKDLRDQLAGTYGVLPQMKDKEMFLSNAVIDSLKAENLTPETLMPVRESEQAGLIFQSANIALPVRFSEFYTWIARIETAKPLMHLQNIDLVKKYDIPGYNTATAEVSTVIPKKRFY